MNTQTKVPLTEEDVNHRILNFLCRDGSSLGPKLRASIRTAFTSGEEEPKQRVAKTLLASLRKIDTDLDNDLKEFAPEESDRVALMQKAVFEGLERAVSSTQPIKVQPQVETVA